MSSKEEDKGTRSLQRALNILKAFTVEEKTLSLTQISTKINLAKSTTTRLLYTLEQNNFVEKDLVTLRYSLGKQLYVIGHIAGQSIKLNEVAQPTMERLRNQTKETVNLYVLEGEHRICILQYESLQSVKHTVKIGEKLPLTVGAAGKVLLAYQSPKFIEKIISLEKIAGNKSHYKNELASIVENHCGISVDEREMGSSAIASPIFDVTGHICGAISISGPTNRFNEKVIEDLKTFVVAGAMEISVNMGYQLSTNRLTNE